MTVDLAAAWDGFAGELAERLAPFGLVVSNDPQTVNPPCVLVGASSPSRSRLAGWSGAVTLDVPVWLIAPGPNDANAERWLLTWAATVADAINVAGLTPQLYASQLPAKVGTARLTVTGAPPAPRASRPALELDDAALEPY